VFERCNLRETEFSGANIAGTGFENCVIHDTKLDIEGFIDLGNSKGFVIGDSVAQ